jgi:hypothetical protein
MKKYADVLLVLQKPDRQRNPFADFKLGGMCYRTTNKGGVLRTTKVNEV